jgi:hypothetical protein
MEELHGLKPDKSLRQIPRHGGGMRRTWSLCAASRFVFLHRRYARSSPVISMGFVAPAPWASTRDGVGQDSGDLEKAAYRAGAVPGEVLHQRNQILTV